LADLLEVVLDRIRGGAGGDVLLRRGVVLGGVVDEAAGLLDLRIGRGLRGRGLGLGLLSIVLGVGRGVLRLLRILGRGGLAGARLGRGLLGRRLLGRGLLRGGLLRGGLVHLGGGLDDVCFGGGGGLRRRRGALGALRGGG